MITIGIDPGLNGGIVALRDRIDKPSDCQYLEWWAPMPVEPKSYGKGNQVDANALSDLLSAEKRDTVVIIERVASMPRQGVAGVFSFGRSVGVLEGVCATLELRVLWVTPQKWKATAGLLRAPKGKSTKLARELWPELGEGLPKARLEGVCEAALIGRFGA